jgi:hypothetical protein
MSGKSIMEDLAFYCVCRYLVMQIAPIGCGSFIDLDPFTTKELIKLNDCMQIAQSLFRIKECSDILLDDANFIEVDNPVYHRYIATSCFQQFGQIITPYLSVTIPMRPESPSTPRSPSRSSPLSRSTSRARNILTSNYSVS